MAAKLVLLGGFLGAGKTTTLIQTAKKLQKRGKRVAIVTNDQGKELIDTELVRNNGLDAEEVTGGCFCCQFEDLYKNLTLLLKEKQPDVILAEAVGSCTDLAATVIQPMKKYYADEFKTAPLTIVVDPSRLMDNLDYKMDGKNKIFSPSVSYIFEKQLAEADIIALNKLDRFQHEEIDGVIKFLKQRYPQAEIRTISAERGDFLEELIDLWLSDTVGGDKVLDIDYDLYAEGEAQLAWMNILGDLTHLENSTFDPKEWVDSFLETLNGHFLREKMAIAHLKIQLGQSNGYVKASMIKTGEAPIFTITDGSPNKQFRVLLNIRIEANPSMLDLIVADAIEATNQQYGTHWKASYHECFSPKPPVPTHRLILQS
ncbi:G3E family GTPase [Anoxybacillus calidus]|uniref:G3E family GTPase n=1 Tax=[Anoxybacillus] calidus TaxID=575178 RepID=A0A7W0BYK8_9BACL|nr:GTP-binding protein [Anoxybacillus calidus]MBA2873174.1 G3E family GTPase [Anoxybacillus calidus]